MKLLNVIVLAGLILFQSPLSAHEDGYVWPCKGDREKFCKDAGFEYFTCLQQRIKDLSDACQKHYIALHAVYNLKVWRSKVQSCKIDAQFRCSDVEFDEHIYLADCLYSQEERLSKKCQAQLNSMKPDIR